jgi:hypothetical protein
MGNIQELENSWLRQKLKKRKELQTLTENLISKYQGKLTGVTVSKADQRTLQLCFMKSSGLQAIR